MGYSVRYGKLGFECDVCGVFIGDLRLLKSCYSCHKDICSLHARWTLKPTSLRPQFRFSRREDKFCYVCPECDEERKREELEKEEEEKQKQEELEEEEAKRVITKCQICTATDEPPEYKTFGYRTPTFSNCERCGKLVCDQCRIAVYDPYYDYDIVCRECYTAKEQEDKRKREEYWREEEESKLEE